MLRACTAAGYEQVFTSFQQAEDLSTAHGTVGRLNVRGGTELMWFRKMLAADGRALQSVARKEQVKAQARRVLGDRLYARLWSVLNRQEEPEEQAEAAGALLR